VRFSKHIQKHLGYCGILFVVLEEWGRRVCTDFWLDLACMRKNRFPDNRNGNLPKLAANLPQFGTFLFMTWPHIGKYQFGGPSFATSHANRQGSQLRALVVTFSLDSGQI
jgi:hypothetical protein